MLAGFVAVIDYTIAVHTGDGALSGTEAKAYVTLYGEHGETEELCLDQKGQDLFASNA
jgi:PLAT/LH2 domain